MRKVRELKTHVYVLHSWICLNPSHSLAPLTP